MRIMTAHLTSDEYIDYYECSTCGWVYPFPRFVKEENKDLPNEEAARRDFEGHDCAKYPKARATGQA